MPKKIFWRPFPSFSMGGEYRTPPPPPPPLSQGLDQALHTEKGKADKNLCTLLVLNFAVAGLSFRVLRDC